jgi:hypothetical protein
VSSTRNALVLAILLASTSIAAAAPQNYCIAPETGEHVRAGSTVKVGEQVLRCCRKAPVSGTPSKPAFLNEEKYRRLWEPRRCWSTGLRTRDFVSLKQPGHRRKLISKGVRERR